jgi:S-disulfanyl-L-cysteine oxidoreductase SoxD
MRSPSVLVPALVLGIALPAVAQTYDIGRTPAPEEIKAWDIAISADGRELPPGSGTVAQGETVYAAKCAACHGRTGIEGPGAKLVAAADDASGGLKEYPLATAVWDTINRAMPKHKEGSLSADESYGLTAFLLYRNGLIQQGDVLDATTLPKVRMPNRDRFHPDPATWHATTPKLPKAVPPK